MSVSRATQSVVVFPLIDASNRPAYKSGASGITTKVSKDGGAFASTTNSATEIATNSGVYALTLTAAEMAAGLVVLTVTATGCDPCLQIINTTGLVDGSITSAASATSFTDSARAETAANHWKAAFLRFTSGSLAGQVQQITGYASGGVFTTNAFTGTPSTGDRYVIVNA